MAMAFLRFLVVLAGFRADKLPMESSARPRLETTRRIAELAAKTLLLKAKVCQI
jgi:hypothetical protein